MRKRFQDIPLWVINLITIISGVITIATPVFTFILSRKKEYSPSRYVVASFVVLGLFSVIMFLRLRKYRSLAKRRMEITSDNYHRLLLRARNTFFDVMHSQKTNSLTIGGLSEKYKHELSNILDNLCKVMNSFTNKEISACIKLISFVDAEETINVDNAKLVTFCRSNNSDTERDQYEQGKEILLKDNTDFYEIVSQDNDKEYFYQRDLEKYDEQLKKVGKHYENSNKTWQKYYAGTIVVPIRIEFSRLYYLKKNDAYHILGFLCIDSISKDAFSEQQEKYNVDVVRSFADIIYILLSQYRHYLKKLDCTLG